MKVNYFEKGNDKYEKSFISFSLLGSLMVGCSNANTFNVQDDKPSIEELENKIKEQEQYITELEQYKQEKENFERQARHMQKQLEYEEEQSNIEKYYMAITDIRIISKSVNDNDELRKIEYGSYNFYELSTNGYYDDITNPDGYSCVIPYRYIPSGTTFKLSDNNIKNYIIKGEYEEIIINKN